MTAWATAAKGIREEMDKLGDQLKAAEVRRDTAANEANALVEEQTKELAELQERQDFTERALLREQGHRGELPAPERVTTPH